MIFPKIRPDQIAIICGPKKSGLHMALAIMMKEDQRAATYAPQVMTDFKAVRSLIEKNPDAYQLFYIMRDITDVMMLQKQDGINDNPLIKNAELKEYVDAGGDVIIVNYNKMKSSDVFKEIEKEQANG